MAENTQENLTNRMIKFLFEGAPVRGAIVEMQQEWKHVLENHQYPPNLISLLGQFTAGAILLASTIKFDGSLILQVKGSGPVSLLIAEVSNGLRVRAMAQVRSSSQINAKMGLQELINDNQSGQCSIILDPKDRAPGVQPYQGIVPLTGNTVSECLETYMRQSEQLETRLWLAADSEHLGGLLIQKMPGTGGTAAEANDPDAWRRIGMLAETVKLEELLSLDAPEVLRRLFWTEHLQVASDDAVMFYCNCSRDRTNAMLLSLGQDECMDIIKAEGKIDVRCQFCNRTQSYTKEDIEELFMEPSQDAALHGIDPERPQ